MYRAKHMNEIYAAEIYSQSQICFGGRMEMALFKSRSSKLHGNLILPWIWNCLDNNYVLLLYRVRLSGRLGLSSLGISALKSADNISLFFNNRIKAADRFLRNTFSSEVFWSSQPRADSSELRFLKVLGSVLTVTGALQDPRAICDIKAFFWTPWICFTLPIGAVSACQLSWPNLTFWSRGHYRQRGCFGERSMESSRWAVVEEFQRGGTEKMHREAVHSKWLPPLSLCGHFRKDFALYLKVVYILWSVERLKDITQTDEKACKINVSYM